MDTLETLQRELWHARASLCMKTRLAGMMTVAEHGEAAHKQLVEINALRVRIEGYGKPPGWRYLRQQVRGKSA